MEPDNQVQEHADNAATAADEAVVEPQACATCGATPAANPPVQPPVRPTLPSKPWVYPNFPYSEIMAIMPADGASQHDRYIYGLPKREA